jgi:hypothetical protein
LSLLKHFGCPFGRVLFVGVINIAQTAWHRFRQFCVAIRGGNKMLTSSECRAQAEEKIAQAERALPNQERLRIAAQGWIVLAVQMSRLEAGMRDAGKIPSKIQAD